MLDVAIVGGGVVGLSLTRALARAGASVSLFERAQADAETPTWRCDGASSLPVALVNPWRGRKGAAHPDDRAGLAVTWRWTDELRSEGLEPGATRSGVLRVPTSERQAQAWRERASTEASLAWLSPESIPAGIRAPHGALRVADGGWIRAGAWRSALADSGRRHGAALHAGAEVVELAPQRDAWRLSLRDGRTHEARTVLLAIGADAPPRTTGAGGPDWPTWIRTRGEEVALSGAAQPSLPIAGGVYATRDGAVTWVGGGHRPTEREDPEAPTNLRAAIAHTVPALSRAPVGRVWSGVRAKRADARPVIERWRYGVWIVGAFAGRGFLCAALEAERTAEAWRLGRLSASVA